MAPLISAKDLTKTYGEEPNTTHALNKVSIEVKKGEFIAIIGPSGSGKSTLMHILGCLDQPTSGKYYLDAKLVSDISENKLAKIRNSQIGFIFQSFNLLPRTSAIKNVQLPLVYSDMPKEKRVEAARKQLERVGLKDKLQSRPNQLSGGQQQRVAIARALVNNPVILFADEPTGNLDSKASVEITEIFRDLNKSGHTIIMITHEHEVAANAARIITIKDGKITSDKRRKRPKAKK